MVSKANPCRAPACVGGGGGRARPGSAAAAGSGVTVKTIVSGMDNPRDLAMGPHGRLYVAEAGHGGVNCSPDGSTCVGRTGDHASTSTRGRRRWCATRVDRPSTVRRDRRRSISSSRTACTDHPRPAGPAARFVSGPAAAAARTSSATLSGRTRDRSLAGDGDVGGRTRSRRRITNLVPGQFPDANPYGVLALPGVRWVVDAGSTRWIASLRTATCAWSGSSPTHPRRTPFRPASSGGRTMRSTSAS